MSFSERIASELKTALLSSNSLVANTLRMLKSEIKYAEIAQGSELNDEAIQVIVKKEVKKRYEAADLFATSGKADLANKEKEEAKILEAYLPVQAERSEVEAFITSLIKTMDSPQKGDIIRQALAHFGSKTDGRTVSEIVGKAL